MKMTMTMLMGLLILAAILFAIPALAADELSPVSVQATQDGALVGVDVGAAASATSSDSWTGVHPGLWFKNNWKGIGATAGTALAAWGAYELYDRNWRSSGGGDSTSAESEDPVLVIPANVGDQTYVGIQGDGNTVSIYNNSPLNPAAAE